MVRCASAVAALVAVAIAAPACAGTCTYTYTQLDAPGAVSTTPFAVNDLGQVVGSFTDRAGNVSAFVWKNGVFTDILGSARTGSPANQFLAINAGGLAVGSAGATGIVYDTTTGQLSQPLSGMSQFFFINDAGTIVGEQIVAQSGTPILLQGNHVTSLLPPGAQSVNLQGLNRAGTVLGVADGARPFLYSNGSFTFLPPPPRPNPAWSTVTDSGAVLGSAGGVGSPVSAFIERASRFSFFRYPGGRVTQPTAANHQGDILGHYYFTGTSGMVMSFVRSAGAFRLVQVPGASLTDARAINGSDTVVGVFRAPATGNHGFVAVCAP